MFLQTLKAYVPLNQRREYDLDEYIESPERVSVSDVRFCETHYQYDSWTWENLIKIRDRYYNTPLHASCDNAHLPEYASGPDDVKNCALVSILVPYMDVLFLCACFQDL